MTLSFDEIRTVAVVGAGTMGRGIAQLAAMAGFQTLLYDVEAAALERATAAIQKALEKGRQRGKVSPQQIEQVGKLLRTTTDIEALQADFIVEAVIEDPDVKKAVFEKLEAINRPETIITSNTSSIPISALSRGLRRPERFGGMHFFNPPHIMKLVEVVRGAHTAASTVQVITRMAEAMGKTPIAVKDAPGFVVNRVARHFYLEALRLLEEGVADVPTIDGLMENVGFRMGPFRLMDLIGVDTNHSVTTSMFRAFFYEDRFRPSRIQQQYVDAGLHGRKSGRGFYTYE